MTVCIGAVCRDRDENGRNSVVVASDRMVTMAQITEFEHEVPKLTQLTDHSVALMAGDARRGMRIVRDMVAHFKVASAATVDAVASATADRYAELRLEQVNNEAFRPRGLTLQAFYTGLQQQLNPQIVVILDNFAQTLNFGTELLVAGVDADGPHLFHIANPGGGYTPFDYPGFGAIGSGALHAVESMIQLRHAPTRALPETVFAVYASKRRAEVAPGVGSATDMAIIDNHGTHVLSSAMLDGLAETYERYSRPLQRELVEDVKQLPLLAELTAENALEPV